ncbi:hypothetical protein B5P45_07105 [Phyllobacterium zundukense]|uniref:Uncharacterized protein n=1 Tax=Phyllobacterium zundukense TaxID=1867719 RepID=A0A2N9W1Y2_9HYPH|nr:hypothetical protein BLM14_07430 [Phyllobacterium zundukense]PIO45750.1 hypothetical protein B5P45_07105 [Phyllobacterium zundukense]
MTKKKRTTQNPDEVFRRDSRHKDFSANMQTGHSLPETDERFEKLLYFWKRPRRTNLALRLTSQLKRLL